MLTKRNKYGNKKIEVDGYVFDSLAESERYKQLKLMEGMGRIEGLKVHPLYVLQPTFRDQQGRAWRAVAYVADFSYQEIAGALVVEDVKGGRATQTAAFRIKEKLFRFRYPELDLRIIEV